MTDRVKIQWHRDPQAEVKMEELGIPYTWTEGLDPVEDFDVQKSLTNQARMGDVKPEVVEKYAVLMSAGTSLPGVIARRASERSKRYIIVGGNHRRGATEQIGGLVAGYTLPANVAGEALLELTYWDNGRNGLPTSREEQIHQGLQYIAADESVASAAAKVGLKPHVLQSAKTDQEIMREARNAGINLDDWDKLKLGVQRDLHKVKTRQGRVALTNLVIKANLSADEVKDAVRHMNETDDADEQIGYVRDVLVPAYSKNLQQKRGATKTTKGKLTTARTIFVGAVRMIDGLNPERVSDYYSTRVERESAIKEIDNAVARLGAIKKELSR